jgi:hypothetical protein
LSASNAKLIKIMKVGYVIASNQLMYGQERPGYLYREAPDSAADSGWRLFSGTESQGYADDPSNFSMYNAITIVEKFPEVAALLSHDFPVAFEREATGDFVVDRG